MLRITTSLLIVFTTLKCAWGLEELGHSRGRFNRLILPMIQSSTQKILYPRLDGTLFTKSFSSTTQSNNLFKLNKQIYTIPTYDAAFKWVLSDDEIRSSFFHAFVPNVKIQSSERLDDQMNPLKDLQILRDFLHKKSTSEVVKSLTGSAAYVARPNYANQGHQGEKDEIATAFLHEMIGHFEEIKRSFPKPRYDGTMDFVCRLDCGDYALVEMQVIPQDYWDRRALAYVAAFYGNQLSKGESWKHIRRVIGINILGGGKNEVVYWSDKPNNFMRYYRFQDQLNDKDHFIDGIELIQYSIMNAPTIVDREKQDWLTFFREASRMTEEDVKNRIKTPAVLHAFERAKINKLPKDVQDAYEAEDQEYNRYSGYTIEQVNKKVQEIAQKLVKDGIPDEVVRKSTGLTQEQLLKLKTDY